MADPPEELHILCIPPFPPEFGEDKGEFFKHYDKIQDELDDEMVKRLKENLDGLLVFAGLFAGVNSAFLAFTLDLLSPNPIDDINSLLQQIIEGLKSPTSLPSMSFTPPVKAVIVNALFTLSLSSALFAAFFAVLGKQWLMLYRNRSGGGVDQQRWEQLRRSLGAERWGLVPVLEVVLPLLIQTSLIIFAAGFVSFLGTASETLAIFVLVPLVVASFLRKVEEDKVLQVESIKRVINISEDPKALYHAALNLRSITGLELLELVCDDKGTTRGLRECYLESLEDLEKKHSREKPNPKFVRETLAFGTAFFHVSLSAASFDDFITMIGIKDVTLPPECSEMSEREAQVSGDSCRRARAFLRKFIWVQMRGLGPQPVELTSTTLAATALWYAINGIPHSQDTIYGAEFREALIFSEVSWAGLGLLTLVSALNCPFYDADARRPYRMEEVDWCRYAFLRVRDTYSLSEPTQELADAIHDALSTDRNLESNAILFKFSWRLFTRDDERDNLVKLGEHALAAGHRLICALDKAIRSQREIRSKETKRSQEAINSLKAISPAEASSSVEAITAQLIISAQAALSSAEAGHSAEVTNTQNPLRSPEESDSAEALSAHKALSALAEITAGRSRKVDPGSPEALSAKAASSVLKALSAQKAAKKYESAREMCFQAMIECMGPRNDEIKILKRAAWRQRLALKTALAYMDYIITLGSSVDDDDNAFAKRVMEKIRDAQTQSLPAVLAMGREYTDIKREFEEAFSKLWPS
ncbi:hypothetical protein FRC01_005092 [Tulasnella sp. 417]|nr:hypothetical protein FRC01_005092 [Tulasnella sp. 417]